MKKILIQSLVFCFVITFNAIGQVTNLKVNGDTANFSMASGDVVSWSYDVPNPGDTTFLDFWIDVNNNGKVDSNDIQWVYFNQIDGDTHGQNGPPDIDGSADGHVAFQQKVGLAPAHYIMTFQNNDSVVIISGTVIPLDSATFTISGSVIVPDGYSKANIALELESSSDNGGGAFWEALTDTSGNFSIRMDADTTGNPWKLSISNSFIFKSATIFPQNIRLTLDSSEAKEYSNNDFTITDASASISGFVKDESGNPIVNVNVYINNSNGNFESDVNSDFNGRYFIGLSSNDLPQSDLNLGSWMDTNYVQFNYNIPTINVGDSLIHDVYLYKANSVIKGRLTLNGEGPGMMDIFAYSQDTGYVRTVTNDSGYYEFRVTNKISNYEIYVGQVPQGYTSDSIVAHAGDTTANLDLKALTVVKQSNGNIPKDYSLEQNYPNPFNPTTLIKYQIPESGFVSLKVYDILGNKVETLVNETESAGSYEIKFNGSDLSSGIYFYQLITSNYSATKKFMLLK
jgi:hypothetical protein